MPNKIKYQVIDGTKECGSCGVFKPIDQFRKARNHYQSACIPCRSIYAAEYRQRPEVKSASAAYSKQYRASPENRDRANANGRRYNRTPEGKEARNAARRVWTAKEKQKAVDYKGGKCVCCGYSGCLSALDFHHRNPEDKEGYGGGALKSHWSFEKNKPEIDKCELVCVRCHREIHAGFRTL